MRTEVARGFEQDRVHFDRRYQAARLRLRGLRSSDLATIKRHERVVRHVLCFKGSDSYSAKMQPGAESSGQPTLAAIGRGTQNSKRFHAALPIRLAQTAKSASKNWLFSDALLTATRRNRFFGIP